MSTRNGWLRSSLRVGWDSKLLAIYEGYRECRGGRTASGAVSARSQRTEEIEILRNETLWANALAGRSWTRTRGRDECRSGCEHRALIDIGFGVPGLDVSSSLIDVGVCRIMKVDVNSQPEDLKTRRREPARREKRRAVVPWITGVRLSPVGGEAVLVNISATGVLVRCMTRLRPERR